MALRVCVLVVTALVLGGAAGKNPMPPISQYLKTPNAEIALARTAAPASISNDATVMILTAHGYSIVAKGRNGFTCLVERAWMDLNIPSSWNVKIQHPVCYNAAASRTVLPYTLKRTTLVLGGATEAQIEETMSGAMSEKTLLPAAPDSIAYMMSKQQYIDDNAKSWYPHLMFFMPQADGDKAGETWGADRSRSPVVYDPHFSRFHDPWAQFFIPVAHWSDGSPAPLYSGT